ncbi:MAG TPA: nucleotidyltransferase family protein [Sphingomonas sp.]|nr:nucleotidyltransferase family protein [Sphingomonas sp.]
MGTWQPPRDLSAGEVRARFRQARRRGNPAWLWPDIAVADWRAALETIAEVARDALFDRPGTAIADGDPDAFGLACYTSGMGPLLGWWQRRGLLRATPDIGRVIDLHHRHNAERSRRLTAAAADVTHRLHAAGVAVVPLKGISTTAYFPAPGTRPMADIDLLVGARDLTTAEAVLAVAGFSAGRRGRRETTWRRPDAATAPHTLMFLHQDDPWSIDLHHSLDQPVAAGLPPIAFDAAEPMANGAPRGLDQPLLLLHLATHAGGGLHNLSLLRLAELHFVARSDAAAGRLSWPAFVQLGNAIGALGYAYPALRLCEDLAPGTIPAEVIERCAAAAPARVVRVVDRLTPATAQRVEGSSIAEHFMWARGWAGLSRQLAADLVPAAASWRRFWAIHERRVWQVLRGQVRA